MKQVAWKQARKNIENSTLDVQKKFKIGYKITPKSNKPLQATSSTRIYPAAPMVLQGGPEVPKWTRRVLPRCQNGLLGFQNGSAEPPKWQLRGAKGPAAEGVPLNIFRFRHVWGISTSICDCSIGPDATLELPGTSKFFEKPLGYIDSEIYKKSKKTINAP